ncbi:MAG: 50S ribosomal protein L4 [Chlamydiales bacterium]
MLKKYNLNAEEIGDVAVEDAFLEVDINHQLIKDYVVALAHNKRQWSANTRGRSEVNHTKKKPYRQKGTGNARQGSLAAPQFKGGGVVFGPKPKFDQHKHVNRKQRRLATRYVLAGKIKEGSILVVEDKVFNGALKEPKTKAVADFLKKQQITNKRLLFVGDGKESAIFKKSMRNIERSEFVHTPNLNAYEAMVAHKIIISESGLKQLQELLQGRKK